MMNGIQAIETFYRGIRFRSRLEARWAKLFSELGINWTYETEGYNVSLQDGTYVRYLPDFVLHGGSIRCPDPLYVEVKGEMKAKDAIKIRAFSNYRPIYVVGAIPENIDDIVNGIDTGYRVPYYNFETVDGDYFGAVLGAAKCGGWGLFGADSTYWREMDETKTRQAYALARMARFE